MSTGTKSPGWEPPSARKMLRIYQERNDLRVKVAEQEREIQKQAAKLAVYDAALAWIDEHYPDATRDLPESISEHL